MALSSSIKDREYGKFIEVDGETAVRTVNTNVNEVQWDEIITTFPDNTSDLFSYYLASVLKQTVLVTYQDNAKKIIVNITKTKF